MTALWIAAAIHGAMLADVTWYAVSGTCADGSQYDPLAYTAAGPDRSWLGRTFTIYGPDGTVTVTVTDTCPGCAEAGILLDISPAAFDVIGDLDMGRIEVVIEEGE